MSPMMRVKGVWELGGQAGILMAAFKSFPTVTHSIISCQFHCVETPVKLVCIIIRSLCFYTYIHK